MQELKLTDIIFDFWDNRRRIILISFSFFLIGILIAFTSRVEYVASCKLIIEDTKDNAGSLGSLGGLAGLAGISLQSQPNNTITPELYPDIVYSIPFQMKLMDQPLHFQKVDTVVSSFEYFSKIQKPTLGQKITKYTLGLPGLIKEAISSSPKGMSKKGDEQDILYLSMEDLETIHSFRKRIYVEVDGKSGIVTISALMPDQYAAAETVNSLYNLLVTEVLDYKLRKSKSDLQFVTERLEESEKKYLSKQIELAQFTDRNKFISNSIVKNEQKNLQNELNILYEVYRELATRSEQAKLKVKEETPIFTVIEPVRIPIKKSKPRRIVTMILAGMLGLIVACFWRIMLLVIKDLNFSRND